MVIGAGSAGLVAASALGGGARLPMDAAAGHSVGEITAASLSGVLTEEQCAESTGRILTNFDGPL